MTTFEIKNEANYAAQVIRVTELHKLDNLDNLVGLHWAGLQALVPATTKVGDLLVVFPAESQLSDEFMFENNLYSKMDLNKDPDSKGYIGNNRRVRAIRLRGERSSALAMSTEAFTFLGTNGDDFIDGTAFDTINGVEVCRKYLTKQPGVSKSAKIAEKMWRRVDDKFLPEHPDTLNYWRNAHLIDPDDHVYVSQKLHGSQGRVSRTICKRKLTWFEKILKKVGVPVAETYTDVIGGSRRVIKDREATGQQHYYKDANGQGIDIWTYAAEKYGDRIPEHVVVYGELIGFLPDTDRPIQKGHTYNVPRGELDFYIYRVSMIAPDGGQFDLSWNGVKEFCRDHNLKHVPELWQGPHKDFDPDEWLDTTYAGRYAGALPLSDPTTVDEGVVVRKDGIIPINLKAKSPLHFEWETKMLDEVEKTGEEYIDG